MSRLERGKFMAINPERLVAIAQVLHTSTDYLLGLVDDPGPIPEDEEPRWEKAPHKRAPAGA